MKTFIIILLPLFILTSCWNSRNEFHDAETGNTQIKYQQSENVSNSEFVSFTWDSEVVKQVWYNQNQKELIIQLKQTKYKYCGVEKSVYESFKNSESLGTFYRNNFYKSDKYDCRNH